MGLHGVPRLHKGLGTHLPVTVHHALHMHAREVLLQWKPLEVIGQDFHIVLKGRCILIKIDKHETTPCRDFDLWQAHVAAFDMLEVPLIGDTLELSFQVPGGAVEGTAKFINRSRLVAQASPAMSARIDVAFDLARRCAGDDHAAVDDPVDVVITGLGNFLFSTGHLPDAGPHLFFFFFKELLTNVSVD